MKKKGFSLIELLVGIGILSILATLVNTSYQSLLERKRLRSAAETLKQNLNEAHSIAIDKRKTIYLSFVSGASWCFGLDDSASCNCALSQDCTINNQEIVVRSTDFPRSTLNVSGYSSGGGISSVFFEGVRGLASTSGQATFSINGKSVTIQSNIMGMVEQCSNDILGYPSCP